MEEIYKLLGLEETASVGQLSDAIQALQSDVEGKQEIIDGLRNSLKDTEKKYGSLADSIRDTKIQSLVSTVQAESNRYVGKDHVESLNKRAARHVMASTDEEREEIYEDMKAICEAYGVPTGLNAKINALLGKRTEDESDDDRRHRVASELVSSKQASNWDEAFQMVLKMEDK